MNGVKNFKAPNFTPFVVTSGPSQSTNMQWINGQMSGSVSYTYMLYARQTGKFTIEPAAIEYKGKTLKTDPLSMEVTQGKPQQAQKKQEEVSAASVGDNLFIKAYADKERVRLGEQLTVTFRLLRVFPLPGTIWQKLLHLKDSGVKILICRSSRRRRTKPLTENNTALSR